MRVSLPITVAIPTFGREDVLVDTIAALAALEDAPQEVLVLDQNARHEQRTESQLQQWSDGGVIRWLRLPQPSITGAMNAGLRAARCPIVLFVDDDVRPEHGLVRAHWAAHQAWPNCVIAGRVIQPWEEGRTVLESPPRSFASTAAQTVDEFIGCNFSVPRELALALGGFDQNFVRVAYRFEAEFAHRARAAGHAIRFEPSACLHHLKAPAGGTRSFGDHLTTWLPSHAVGAYYFALRTREWRTLFLRPWRSVATRYHLRRPWRVVPTLVAELAGILWAAALFMRGPRYLPRGEVTSSR